MSRWLLWVLLGAAQAQAQGFDFVRQDVSVDLTQGSPLIELELSVKALASTATFDFLIPPADVVGFEVDGSSVTPVAHPGYPQYLKQVRLPTPLAPGQTAVLKARIAGPMQCQAAPSRPPACFTGGGRTLLLPASYDAAWYFVNLYEEDDPFESKVTVRAPASQSVLAGHGDGTTQTLPDGSRQWTFSLAVPQSSLFLAASDYATLEAKAGAYSVRAYFPRAIAVDREQRAVDLVSDVLPIYARLYGDLPIRQAHLITVPPEFPAAGMGLLGNVLVAEYLFTDQFGYLLEQGMAHEFAHSWWGNLTTGSGDERGFLAEAFAEYSAWRALGELKGDAVRTAGMRMNAVWYMYGTPAGADVAPLSTDIDRHPSYVFVTYHKGPVVLRALEEVAGVSAFTAALSALAKQPTSSMEQLVSEVTKAGGPDLRAEVDQWLRHSGFPKLTVTPRRDGGKLRWEFNSQGAFSYRLPLRARLAGGRVHEQVLQVQPGASSHSFTGEGELETVELDPRWTLPREIKPSVPSDVTFDGVVDGRDLLEVAVRLGGALPEQRRVDGHYDPLFDVNGDRLIDSRDLSEVVIAALSAP